MYVIDQGCTRDAVAANHALLRNAGAILAPDGAARQVETGSSRLTGSGYPLELGFTTSNASVRVTTDPALSVARPADRLAEVAIIAHSMNSQPLPAGLQESLCNLQQGPLKYGAWLGLRSASQGYKIYSEVAKRSNGDWKSAFPTAAARMSASRLIRQATLRIVGYDSNADSLEFYFKPANLDPDCCADLLAPMGIGGAYPATRDFIEDAYGHRIRSRWPGGNIGVSYSMRSNAENAAITLYFHARSFWGRDANIRKRFARYGQRAGIDVSVYRHHTRGCIGNETCLTQHGLLGFVIKPHEAIDLCIGYCPRDLVS